MDENVGAVIALVESGDVERAVAALKFLRSRIIGMAEALAEGGFAGHARAMQALAGERVVEVTER